MTSGRAAGEHRSAASWVQAMGMRSWGPANWQTGGSGRSGGGSVRNARQWRTEPAAAARRVRVGGGQWDRQRFSGLVWMHDVNDLGVFDLGKGKPKMVEMI